MGSGKASAQTGAPMWQLQRSEDGNFLRLKRKILRKSITGGGQYVVDKIELDTLRVMSDQQPRPRLLRGFEDRWLYREP